VGPGAVSGTLREVEGRRHRSHRLLKRRLGAQRRHPGGARVSDAFCRGDQKGIRDRHGHGRLHYHPAQAEQIIATGLADAVVLARELLRNPYWLMQAAKALKIDPSWPAQYLLAKS
jgi:2,4-dienoyl-CoA reductase-like NADH-dependent reductase (Old Yellow Enzyme family)